MISLKKREQSLHEEAIYPIVAALRAKPYSIIGMDRVSHRIRRVMVFVSHYARVQVLIEAKRRSALKKSCNRLAHGHTDQINEDAKDRAFSDTQNLFGSIGAMYMTHGFDILGFGKSLLEKGNLDDLLSVPDLAAGVLQDLLTAQDTGNDIPPAGTKSWRC
jgi:hypothetical protein